MKPEELIQKLNNLSENMRKECAEIIAEAAVTYYKNAFRDKAFALFTMSKIQIFESNSQLRFSKIC